MTMHASVYWSFCVLTATALLASHERAATAASRMGGRHVLGEARQANAPQPNLEERVASVVKSEMLAKGIPSVSVAVMRDGKMVLERAWGVTDIEKNVSASPATTYLIGSNTKQFTAALLLKQVDRGRLALTDPIGKHLTGLSAEVGAVTIEQLLNHTSGLQRSVSTPQRRFENVTVETLLTMAAGTGKLETKPGTTFTYSNAGYALLGILVEKLYGKKYGAALQEEIAGPLQLATLRMCAEPQSGEARGYSLEPGSKPGPPLGLHYSQSLGSGGICSTAADLVRWTHAFHTGRVLSPTSYQAMTTPRGAVANASEYGFGLSVSPTAGKEKAISHGGQSLTGHVAELHWFPEHRVAVALLYNVFPRVPGIGDLIPRVVLGVPPPATKAAPSAAAAPTSTPSAPTTPADRATLAGVYELAPQRTFEVTLENGELYVTPRGGEKQPLVFRSGNTYMRDADIITFIVENGVVTGFEANAGGNKRMLKKIK